MRTLLVVLLSLTLSAAVAQQLPVVVNTWAGSFMNATAAAYQSLISGNSLITAIEAGCNICEYIGCDGSVGWGGSPDETGETTLDAMIMDGDTNHVGAVGGLRRIKRAISVARAVMEHTTHTLLVGDAAVDFAVSNGFVQEDLHSNGSKQIQADWLKSNCQPNYRRNVTPDPTKNCGPYHPIPPPAGSYHRSGGPSGDISTSNHDTIAMIAISADGLHVASGTSTNGLTHKVPGLVGDSPITGAGSYADSDAGGCGATGDGDVMMRFLPCLLAVENMRAGMDPKSASEAAIRRILRKVPQFTGSIVSVDTKGNHGGAGHGWTFVYSVQNPSLPGVTVYRVPPIEL